MKNGLLLVVVLSILGAAGSTALFHQHPIANHIQIAYQNHGLATESPQGTPHGLEVHFRGQDAFVSGTFRTRDGIRANAEALIVDTLKNMPVDKIIGGPSPAIDHIHFDKNSFRVVPVNRPWIAMSSDGDRVLLLGSVADKVTRDRIGQAVVLKNPIATLDNQIVVDSTATLHLDLEATLAGVPLLPIEEPRIRYSAAWLGEDWRSWDHDTNRAELRAALKEFFPSAQSLDYFLGLEPSSGLNSPSSSPADDH